MTRQRPRSSPGLVLPVVLVALIATAGCGGEDPAAAEPDCATTVRSAALAVETRQQVVLLDAALRRCGGIDQLTTEMSRYPNMVGFSPATFVALRCSRSPDPDVQTGPVCSALAAPATTPQAAANELVFVGATLDGRTVEIRPDADTPFVGQLPAVVQQTVDIAAESGCEGVIAQRDAWAARTVDPEIGDEASVYAKHAELVAAYLACPFAPIVPPTVPPTVPSTPATTVGG